MTTPRLLAALTLAACAFPRALAADYDAKSTVPAGDKLDDKAKVQKKIGRAHV